MTNEEAISVIKTEIGQFIIDEKWKNALALAISALRAIDQYKGERDIAVEQLKELGYELGEKIRTDTDCVSRQAAIDTLYHVDEYNGRSIEAIRNLPSAQPELTDDRAIEHLQSTGWMQNHDKEMYEMGLREQLADDGGSYDSLIPSGDTILRQGAIDAIKTSRYLVDAMEKIIRLPSAQPTLYGYNVEHLILIAEVLRKENMPPERVAEALTDIGRIVAIVRDEFEKSFRKAVEQCMT